MKKILALILILIAIVIAFSGGYWLRMGKIQIPVLRDQPKIEQSAQEEVKEEQREILQTYKNDKYSFEINYPKAWYLSATEDEAKVQISPLESKLFKEGVEINVSE